MKTILLVEDDRRIVRALDFRLKAHGFGVRTAFDAVNAMNEALSEVPTVIVLDIYLPGGSGLMVGERLRHDVTTTDVPLIFITASRQPRFRERAAELSAAAFLEKPFTAGELLDAIELAEHGRRWGYGDEMSAAA